MFPNLWRALEAPPTGGSSQTLVVTAGGTQFTVEDYLIANQQAAAGAIYDAVKALAKLWIGRQTLWEDLDRDGAIQTRVARFVDFTHPARADGSDNFVGSKARAGGHRHLGS